MTDIDRQQLQRMMTEVAATVVEVLGKDQYDDFHLPGAVNVPLGDTFTEAIRAAVPDKHQPVVVYCWDENCDASPKAAKRMEQLGYDRVYDYVAGKADGRGAGELVES
jgi:rhodanese-related sulfurtransferase